MSNLDQMVLERLIEIIELMKEIKSDHLKKPLVLKTSEAAAEMRISLPTLRDHFLVRPDFPKVRAGTKYLIPYDALYQWLNQHPEFLKMK
ncbi:Helix-turn-helix domain-containing protein [Seinonella peptonophila]|uniref:Helix-turn-helix domain-containing protein n=1 Tax=Seinonella peptonophila TaxID=112248 RepID=A0A1M5A0V1_9BACL|nr:helix-turn-helix domain-containing protein [Seinonella peptonophila]SHF23895.1 Helix-turn-helix domain-containing protein [Seinonella peptonophila]